MCVCQGHETWIFHCDDDMITSTKNMLNSRFDMKDLGLVDVILGIKIKRISYRLHLSQSHYVDNILGKFDKDNSGITRMLRLFHMPKLFPSVGTKVVKHYTTVVIHSSSPQGVVL